MKPFRSITAWRNSVRVALDVYCEGGHQETGRDRGRKFVWCDAPDNEGAVGAEGLRLLSECRTDAGAYDAHTADVPSDVVDPTEHPCLYVLARFRSREVSQ